MTKKEIELITYYIQIVIDSARFNQRNLIFKVELMSHSLEAYRLMYEQLHKYDDNNSKGVLFESLDYFNVSA